MAGLPTICNSCGTLFPSFGISGENATIKIGNCWAGPCPQCGGYGRIVEGTYEFLGEAVRLVVTSLRSREQVLQLQSILQRAQQARLAPEALPAQVHAVAPELGGISAFLDQYVKPKNAGEFWAIIGALLAALAILIPMWSTSPAEPKPSFDEKQVEVIVEKAVASALAQTQAARKNAAPKKTVTSKKKTGRNERCPCNSGKKYKMCCLSGAKPAS